MEDLSFSHFILIFITYTVQYIYWRTHPMNFIYLVPPHFFSSSMLIIFFFKVMAAVLSVLWLGPDLKKSASSSHHPTWPSYSCGWLSTAPPLESLGSPPGLWWPMWLSSFLCLDQDQDLDLDPDLDPVPDLDPQQSSQLWFHCGRGRPPQCWRWTAGSGPGSNGKPPGRGSSALHAGPAQTASVCVWIRSLSWCRSSGWWRRQPCSRWRNPRPCWLEEDRDTLLMRRLENKQ